MKSKKLLFSVFILVALAQIFVPWQMISKHANFAEAGAAFKFKIDSRLIEGNNRAGASIRGKYIWLDLAEDHIKIADRKEWEQNESAFILFTRDSLGFAKIESVTKTQPQNSADWVRAGVWINWRDSITLHVNYPFNQYYIKDTNPKDIESVIKHGLNDSTKVNYLDIKIRENQFYVNDLVIDGVSFKDLMDKLKKSSKP